MERIIRNEIVSHMKSNNLFAEERHGFIAGNSCTTQLLEFMEEITEALDRRDDVDVIYLDFAKAFDKVPHQRLLAKPTSRSGTSCPVDSNVFCGELRLLRLGASNKWNSTGQYTRPCALPHLH